MSLSLEELKQTRYTLQDMLQMEIEVDTEIGTVEPTEPSAQRVALVRAIKILNMEIEIKE